MQYRSSVSDFQWQILEEFFSDWGYSNKGRKHELRDVVDAILYLVDNGVKWRSLPNDFPPWRSVHYNFSRWAKEGLWEELNLLLVRSCREISGRDPEPSLVSIDSQSQDGEPGIEDRGLDGNKRRNGRKRHIAVDVMGFVLHCICTPANEADRHAGERIVRRLNEVASFPRLARILGDNAYIGVGWQLQVPITVEAEARKKSQKGFVPEAFRWVVERSFACLNRQRRISRNYEKKIVNQQAVNYIANIRLCIKKIDRHWWQNFRLGPIVE